MARNGQNEMLFAAGAALLHRAEDHCVYTLGGSDGRVQITQYAVFPGIWILYRDVHAGVQLPVAASTAGLLEIDHCREGRMEFQYGQAHFFLSPGDLAVLRCDAARSAASFPTGHYHGISVMIDPHRAPDCLSCILRDVNVRPAALAEKLCAGTAYFAARSSARVEHIFSELYNVPEDIRRGYFKVKVLELLLFLSALPAEPPRRSYTGAQVALAKAAGERLLVRRRANGRWRRWRRSSACRRRSSRRASAAFTGCRLRRICERRRCTLRRSCCARPTGRCWTSPGSSAMTTAASSPRPSAVSSA